MPTENLGQQLHDKATRGEPLNPEEQTRLDAWYAQLDQAERAQLAGKPSHEPLAKLPAQVADATAELLSMTQQLQTLTRDAAFLNDLLFDRYAERRAALPSDEAAV